MNVMLSTSAREQYNYKTRPRLKAESWGPEACLAIALEEGLSANLLAPRKVEALNAWAQISAAHCSVEVVQVDEPLVAEQEHPIAGFDGPAV